MLQVSLPGVRVTVTDESENKTVEPDTREITNGRVVIARLGLMTPVKSYCIFEKS